MPNYHIRVIKNQIFKESDCSTNKTTSKCDKVIWKLQVAIMNYKKYIKLLTYPTGEFALTIGHLVPLIEKSKWEKDSNSSYIGFRDLKTNICNFVVLLDFGKILCSAATL